jgi:hypothetical protein
MRGIIIHHRGSVRRALVGRRGEGRLSIKPIMSVVPPQGQSFARPIRFVFYDGNRQLAASSRVILLRGRRYQEVEHWFVLPESAERSRNRIEKPQPSDGPIAA